MENLPSVLIFRSFHQPCYNGTGNIKTMDFSWREITLQSMKQGLLKDLFWHFSSPKSHASLSSSFSHKKFQKPFRNIDCSSLCFVSLDYPFSPTTVTSHPFLCKWFLSLLRNYNSLLFVRHCAKNCRGIISSNPCNSLSILVFRWRN